jgi:hypothetical protein
LIERHRGRDGAGLDVFLRIRPQAKVTSASFPPPESVIAAAKECSIIACKSASQQTLVAPNARFRGWLRDAVPLTILE